MTTHPNTLTLPFSGRMATFRRLKGRDLIEAERQCGEDFTERQFRLAMLARRTILDGTQAAYPDIEALDEDDVAALFLGVEAFLTAERGKATAVPDAEEAS